jgi:hypothetical protein
LYPVLQLYFWQEKGQVVEEACGVGLGVGLGVGFGEAWGEATGVGWGVGLGAGGVQQTKPTWPQFPGADGKPKSL